MTTSSRSTSTTAATHDAPSRTELVARAAALRDRLWADAPQADRDRRLDEGTVAAIKDAGLFRLLTPRRFGGYETDARTLLDVVTELGRGCGSAAWVTGVLNAGNFVAALFPDEAREEVWGDNPDAGAALVLGPGAPARKVEGGALVTAKWPYSSGAWHCDWAVVVLPVQDGDAAPELFLALVPMRDTTVEDTWFITGLRGTGSNTIVVDGKTVPDHRLIPLAQALDSAIPPRHPEETLYRSSFSGMLLTSLLGAQLGEVRTGLELVLEKAPKRSINASNYTSQVQSVTFQTTVAEAATKIDTALFHAYRLTGDIDAHARRDEAPDVPTRVRVRTDSAYASRQCREAIDLLVSAHGTSAFAEFNPLQRIWRDVNVANRHAGFGAGIPEEMYGRVLLGEDPQAVSFLL
ncbi:acyl-CoA dehydrogenase family protein [Streptomyces luteireticuli]|uniref:acyl-CoA dehydrogenase family protein n=1 Tax=Streptomyces luteireticuli TaxID=173858 RepID=UPI003558BE6C